MVLHILTPHPLFPNSDLVFSLSDFWDGAFLPQTSFFDDSDSFRCHLVFFSSFILSHSDFLSMAFPFYFQYDRLTEYNSFKRSLSGFTVLLPLGPGPKS